MCSVTFWPRQDGYLLGMNRDESLIRVVGLPPTRITIGTRTAIHPSEPGGGTWTSLNDHGVGIALINWYAITTRASQPTASRGDVVLALRNCRTADEAADLLSGLPLVRTNPFRVIGFFAPDQEVWEWRWNLRELACLRHDWSPSQWLSSGYDEPTAQRIRGTTFDSMRREPDAGSIAWLRRLHASHGTERGPFSICMHRDDAATVSYSELEVSGTLATMRHCLGAPCRARDFLGETISICSARAASHGVASGRPALTP